MRYLENYLERIKRKGNLTLADAISKTVSDVVPQYISNFSFREHVVSLLVGDVQSGKTSHMFGLMCAAADEGFVNFILLTTDNILLQQSPQADTMWQHARMFGYDRDSELMRVFMPPKLFKLFSDINRTNNIIISQIEKSNNGNDIKIFYSTGLNPTRKNVIDKKAVGIYSGGVNYFPFYPVNKDIVAIDEILAAFADEVYTVSLKLISKVLDLVDSETTDWNAKVFKGFINSMLAENSSEQGKIIVRRDRDISKGTGTLLSPNDRKLGDQYDDEVVLTLYKVTGNKGWDGQKIWIPNIKLPGNRVYYSGNDIPEQDNKLCYDILVNTAKVAESTIPYDHNNK